MTLHCGQNEGERVMKHRMPIFDGDGHVLETDEQLDKYYEGNWKGSRRLRSEERRVGKECRL